MFKVVDMIGNVCDAYGTFVDEEGDIQFILCDNDGLFYTTNKVEGYYKLFKEENGIKYCDANKIFELLEAASWKNYNTNGKLLWLDDSIKIIKDNIR